MHRPPGDAPGASDTQAPKEDVINNTDLTGPDRPTAADSRNSDATGQPRPLSVRPPRQPTPRQHRPTTGPPHRHLHTVVRAQLTRPTLSEREVEVLIAWLHAESKQEAAGALFITAATVSTHIARIRAKYEAVARPAPSKASLFARAIQDGYVSLDDW
ncbi:hypothetical protein GCM10009624_02600 [Gordonia sinesedis]